MDASLSIMKTITAGAVVAAILFGAPLQAQNTHGYAFIAPGNETDRGSYGHVGIGGVWLSRYKVGVGAEVGGIWGRRFASSLAVISGNGVFHLPLSGSLLDPFATLGVTVLTNGSSAGYLTNYGGGANYWFRPRLVARFEIRDHYWHSESIHLTDFRFGIAFR
jgi:hypothetical protein